MSTKRNTLLLNEHLTRIGAAFTKPWDFNKHLLAAMYVGSTAHGTYTPKSDPDAIDDIDIMGILVPPLPYKLSLHQFEHWNYQQDELDVVTYSLEKWAGLILKGNPNVCGLLWIPNHLYLTHEEPWNWWVSNRAKLQSKRMHASFSGYAYAQLQKLGHPGERAYMGAKRKELVERYGYDTKNAAHCVRLLNMGRELLLTGTMHVDRTGLDADLLRSIKKGELKLSDVQDIAKAGFAGLDDALKHSPLPDEPDTQLADELVFSSYYWFWKQRDQQDWLNTSKSHYG